MDYSLLTREELIGKLEEKEILVSQLLLEKEQETRLDYAWNGNLGAWYWNVRTDTVTFNPLKATTLGYSPEELPQDIGFSFFTEKLHPDDYQKVMQSMLDHLQGNSPVYEVEYRIQAKDGSYKWYYDRGKITRYEESGKPLFLAGIVFDITEKKKMQESLESSNRMLEKLSQTDGLTGLLNHRALFEQLDVERIESQKQGIPLSIALLDLDDFKGINDTYGHLAGDRILASVARILEGNTRDCDTVGRYGGDEFLVILRNTGKGDACKLFERILGLARQVPVGENNHVSISVGVCEYSGESLREFVAHADKNLYKAKALGKNQVACFG